MIVASFFGIFGAYSSRSDHSSKHKATKYVMNLSWQVSKLRIQMQKLCFKQMVRIL